MRQDDRQLKAKCVEKIVTTKGTQDYTFLDRQETVSYTVYLAVLQPSAFWKIISSPTKPCFRKEMKEKQLYSSKDSNFHQRGPSFVDLPLNQPLLYRFLTSMTFIRDECYIQIHFNFVSFLPIIAELDLVKMQSCL